MARNAAARMISLSRPNIRRTIRQVMSAFRGARLARITAAENIEHGLLARVHGFESSPERRHEVRQSLHALAVSVEGLHDLLEARRRRERREREVPGAAGPASWMHADGTRLHGFPLRIVEAHR